MSAVNTQTQAKVTAAQALANYKATGAATIQNIQDSSANVAAMLDRLRPLVSAGDIASIVLTDNQPLSISQASYVADTQVLAMLGAGYGLILSAVSAGSAAAIQGAAHVVSFVVADTASAVASNLDALNAATRLTSIVLTSGIALTVTAGQFATDTAALGKLPANYTLTVTGVTAQTASFVQSASHAVSFSVTDTAANVLANLAALNAAGKLSTITVSDTTSLTITSSQLNLYRTALGKLPVADTLIVTGVTAAGATAVQATSGVKYFSVADTAASVVQNLTALNAAAKLTIIAVTDAKPLAISESQFTTDAAAIGKLGVSTTLAISAVAAADAQKMQTNVKVVSFSVSDTAANVAANLAILNASTKLQSIALSGASPLAVSVAQAAAYSALFLKLPAAYTLAVSGVTASGAGAVQATGHVASFSVSDSSTNVLSYLDALNGYSRLSAIGLTDTHQLVLGYTRYSNDAAALGKIGGAWSATVSNVAAAPAAGVQASSHVAAFTVSDTANAVASNIDALNNDGKLGQIAVTGGGPLLLTAQQLVNDTAALGKIVSYQAIATGVAVANIAAVQTNTHVAGIEVVDTAANIVAALSVLNSNSLVTTIALSGGTSLAVTYAQLAPYGLALGKLVDQDQLSVVGVAAANALAVQQNGLVESFGVSDTAANIVANLDALTADGKLVSIAIAGTPTLSIGYSHFMPDFTALGKLTGAYTMTVTGATAAGAATVAANTHVAQFTVGDTLGDIGASLDQLEAAVKTGKLTAIAVTNPGGSITVGAAQYAADAGAIALMTGSFTIDQLAASVPVTVAPTTASASSGLNAPSLTFLGTPAVTVMNNTLFALDTAVSPVGGILEIAQFSYGVDELMINLSGAAYSALAASDTTVGGLHAVALYNKADPTHGLVLTGLPAKDTAADLLANHLTFSLGRALIG